MTRRFSKGDVVRCVKGREWEYANVPVGTVGVIQAVSSGNFYWLRWFAYPDAGKEKANTPRTTLTWN